MKKKVIDFLLYFGLPLKFFGLLTFVPGLPTAFRIILWICPFAIYSIYYFGKKKHEKEIAERKKNQEK